MPANASFTPAYCVGRINTAAVAPTEKSVILVVYVQSYT